MSEDRNIFGPNTVVHVTNVLGQIHGE